MGLRELAERDLGRITEDSAAGWGWPITLTDPAGASAPLVGFTTDISQAIDPDTGQLVSGAMASVAIRITQLLDNGFVLPRGITDRASKPWVVTFDDINGNAYTFKIKDTMPDKAIGLIVCMLETYAP